MYNGLPLALKKNDHFPFGATWMDLEGTMLGEVGQRETNIV